MPSHQRRTCKKPTEALKGAVTVESELGKGSKFTIEIPLHAEK